MVKCKCFETRVKGGFTVVVAGGFVRCVFCGSSETEWGE
jgi:hypothetical protein